MFLKSILPLSVLLVTLLQPDERVGGNVDDIQTVPEDASKRRKMSTGPGRRKEEESHKGTSHVETKKTPVKRTSKRLQSKMQSDQARFTSQLSFCYVLCKPFAFN